jgi:hypothetical protein
METLARQAQVRAKDLFVNNLFLQKIVILYDFDEV